MSKPDNVTRPHYGIAPHRSRDWYVYNCLTGERIGIYRTKKAALELASNMCGREGVLHINNRLKLRGMNCDEVFPSGVTKPWASPVGA